LSTAGATVRVSRPSATAVDVRVTTNGKPFWLVLGESDSTGWHAQVSDGAAGSRQLVDGYANGWLIRPDRSGTMTVRLRWTPQRLVWIALAASALAVFACAAIVMRAAVRDTPEGATTNLAAPRRALAGLGDVSRGAGEPLPRRSAALFAGATAAVTVVVAPWWVAVLAGAAAFVTALMPVTAWALVIAAPAALGLARAAHRPTLAWLALALVGAEVARTAWPRRRARGASP
jgi:hypothetical protein